MAAKKKKKSSVKNIFFLFFQKNKVVGIKILIRKKKFSFIEIILYFQELIRSFLLTASHRTLIFPEVLTW